MRYATAAIIFALLLMCPAQGASPAIYTVWANDGADKVTQDELRASNGTSVVNRLWDGSTISLFGAKNEVVNFNLILEAPTDPAANVSVSISNLTGPNGWVIRSSPRSVNNLFDWTTTEIELFHVSYLQITGLSGFGGSLAGFQEPTFPQRAQCPASEAAGCAWTDRPVANKFYPDIAVPLELVPSFNIAAGNNQSIWADVYIPKIIAAGTYTGTVTISENGVTTHTVPISLTVRNFSLPDSPNSKTMLFSDIGDLYPRYGGATALQAYQNEVLVAHRHKISLIDGSNMGAGWNGGAPAAQWIPFLDGSAFMPANGYAGPGVATGNGVFSIGTYGSMTGGTTQSAFTTNFNNWETWFEANSPSTERFVYLCDEINCQQSTPDLPTQLGWWSAIAGPGQNLHTMATQPLLNVVSTALSNPTTGWAFSEGTIASSQAAADSVKAQEPTRRLFAYGSGRPGSGSQATEDVGVAFRELPWGQYKKGVDRWYIWEATYYNNYQGLGNCNGIAGSPGCTNVFTTAQTFGGAPDPNLNYSYGLSNHYTNGDGVLFYPGTDLIYPSYSYGIDGPIASLRLKHWRRGIQDVDYLVLASQINPTAVQNLVNQMVPAALWENQCHDVNDCSYFIGPISWSENPDDWESARSQLADIIDSAIPATTATTSLTSSLNPSNFGLSVTFTATVTATSSGTPTGTVTFWDDATQLGTRTLSSGTATFSTTSLSVGNHSIAAIYSGDSNFATSTSAPLSQTVNTGVTLQVSPTTSLNAAGSEGGPFGPTAFQIQLSGDIGSVDYSISGVPGWLTASSTSGTVTTSPTTVTFTVNASANRLTAGNYTATITITNTDNGQGTLALSAGLGVNQTNQGGGGGGGGTQNAGIWITGPMVKVLQTNAAFGTGQSLQISASRNEFADFQVHAVPTANPIQMNVTVSDLTNSQAGYTIHSAKNVFLYREAYLNITTPSDQYGTLGVTPDPLIPTVDPFSGQARNAFPFTVPANQTQSAWIDVLVPPGAPPGNYLGTVTISDGSNVIGQLSVALNVWAFTLPSTATLKSAFGMSWNGMCIAAYGDADNDNGYSECAQYPGSNGNVNTALNLIYRSEIMLGLDHRISLFGGYGGPPPGDWSQFNTYYADLINGSAATALSGAAMTTVLYSPGSNTTAASTIQDWVSQFTANGWLATLYDNICNYCSFSDALAAEQTIYAGSPDLKTMMQVNIADAAANNLLSDLNIIVPPVEQMEPRGGSNQRSSYNSFLSGANGTNKHLWWYQACETYGTCTNYSPGPATGTYPSYMIDASPVRNRVFQWLAFIDGIEAEYYQQVDYCWFEYVYAANACGGSSNPWVGVYHSGGNGDQTLIYPGTPAEIGGTTPVPVPSIRLKLIRDGMQDYEYLHALSQAGQGAFVTSTVQSFITNAYTFSNDPQALLAARQTLGNQLNQVVPATTLTSSLNASNFGQSVTFTATVTANAGTPTGTVTFFDNVATALGTGTLSSGTATFTTTSLSVGSHSITAVYSGDGNFATSTSSPLTQIVNQTFTLSVSESGNGTVTSSPSVINCGATCGANFASGTQVALTATAGSGSYFSGWGGACSGTGSCVVTMSSAQSVSATFVSGASSTLSVFISGNGTATSTPSGISCTPTCSASFAIGQQVTLYAAPAIGWTFSGWTGACSGTGGCSVTMNAAQNVAATFTSTGGTQSSRTWVSASTGSDSNPCSRTAPCLTFAGALANTPAGGEIDVLDPGDFGPVTITKAITIDGGDGQVASIILVGTHGINVLAGSTDGVTLRNLRFNGLLNGVSPGTFGVVINSAGKTVVEKCDIFGFSGGGIDVIPTNGTTTIKVQETNISNNGAGIIIKPSGGAVLNASIEHTHIYENGGGGVKVDGTAGGSSYVAITDSSISLNTSNGMNAISGAGGNVAVDMERVVFANNGLAGIQAGISSGGTSMVTVSDSILSYNGSAWSIVNGATLLSFKHNQVTGPTGTPPIRGFFQ